MKLISDALFCRETVGQYVEKPQKPILRKFLTFVITETRDSVEKVMEIRLPTKSSIMPMKLFRTIELCEIGEIYGSSSECPSCRKSMVASLNSLDFLD